METDDQVQKDNIKKYISEDEINDYLNDLEKIQKDINDFEDALKQKFNKVKKVKIKLQNKIIEYQEYLQKTKNDLILESTNEKRKKLVQEIQSFSNLYKYSTSSIIVKNDDITKLMDDIIAECESLHSKINFKDPQKTLEDNNQNLEIKTYPYDQNSNKNILNNNSVLLNSNKEKIKQIVTYEGNIPLFFGSILTSQPSYIVNYGDTDKQLLIGFKNGSISIGQFQENHIALST